MTMAGMMYMPRIDDLEESERLGQMWPDKGVVRAEQYEEVKKLLKQATRLSTISVSASLTSPALVIITSTVSSPGLLALLLPACVLMVTSTLT
jgi:hypothetical protein